MSVKYTLKQKTGRDTLLKKIFVRTKTLSRAFRAQENYETLNIPVFWADRVPDGSYKSEEGFLFNAVPAFIGI